MSPPNPDAVTVASVPPSAYRGPGYRHLSPGYDPLDGQGARINGGRFNPPDSFPVLYICVSRESAVGEFERLGKRQPVGASGLLPRELYEYQLDLHSVLELNSTAVQDMIGVQHSQLLSLDWAISQRIGKDALAAGFQAVRSPSATGFDDILAVFPELIGTSGRIEARLVEVWSTMEDIYEETGSL